LGTTGAFEGVNIVKSQVGQQVEKYHPDEDPPEGPGHSAFSDELDGLVQLDLALFNFGHHHHITPKKHSAPQKLLRS
jgi:hypothetical protein